MNHPTLVIFVREPRVGRVKTRLGRDIGMIDAAWWFRHQARAVVRRLAADRRWRTVLAVTPDAEARTSRFWPANLPRLPQGPGDLGQRMTRALGAVPPGPAAIVGADIPALRPAHVAAGLRLLGPHSAVLGPAPDGGFWLIGLRHAGRPLPRRLLEGVRWSGPHALADTLAALARHGLADVGFAPVLADVDRAADLQADPPVGRWSGAKR